MAPPVKHGNIDAALEGKDGGSAGGSGNAATVANLRMLVAVFGLTSVAFFVATVVLATEDSDSTPVKNWFVSKEDREKFNAKCPDYETYTCPVPPNGEAPTAANTCFSDALTTAGFNSAFDAKKVTQYLMNDGPCNPCRESQRNKQISALINSQSCFDPSIVDVTQHTSTNQHSALTIAGITNNTIIGSGQAGANVTKGYKGASPVPNAKFDGTGATGTMVTPITKRFYETDMCPVNVHWHLGAEHYSEGQYSCEYGKCGPGTEHKKTQSGLQCNHYDASNSIFTKKYDWKFCGKVDGKPHMEVGQTYEVHWPHSALGACGTPYQYQYPFPDGVFCNVQGLQISTIDRQTLASNIGVQAQVFTVVNDERYYFPNLLKGMVVNKELQMGTDMAVYTGSTTGQSVNNKDSCSMYNPVTWQVDRKCHLISASSFDKLCADMLAQRDDMSKDTYPHGSREVVAHALSANNQQDLAAPTKNQRN